MLRAGQTQSRNRRERRRLQRLRGAKGGAAPAVTRAHTEAVEHYKAGRLSQAEAACAGILAKHPRDAAALKLLAMIAFKRDDFQAAKERLAAAQAVRPNDADLWTLMAMCLARLGDLDGAIAAYQRSLALKPGNTAALNNMANALSARGSVYPAVGALRQAIEIDPKDPVLYHSLANALFKIDKLDACIANYEKALELKPDFTDSLGSLLHTCYHACRWERLDELNEKANELIRTRTASEGLIVEMPLANVTRCDDLAINRMVAVAECQRIKERAAGLNVRFSHAERRERERSRITIGYLSNAFRQHPTAYLMWRLFELHDRSRFAIHAYSTGSDDKSEARRHIEETVERFVDIRSMETAQAAQVIHDNEVDVLVDLDGHIQGERLEIAATRPAPVTASYLGFPGTTGADFIDYIITDKIVSPPEHAPWYTETFAYLPHTYQCNDRSQAVSSRVFSRGELGLPDNGFVLCSLNQAYKIEPVMFDVWMRLLKALPDSVLWLWRNNPVVDRNLRREAESRGVSAERLVFAEKLPRDEHLARLHLADLALDTRIYNGHTTTSDTLWAGVPVVTLQGRHFASRVSASLLTAIGLPELITRSLEDYEALVLRLARNREELEALRDKLSRNRSTEPLFDTPRLVRNLERAYEEMVRIWRAGEEPRQIEVTED
jgi:protein O-GlcNAc transferase